MGHHSVNWLAARTRASSINPGAEAALKWPVPARESRPIGAPGRFFRYFTTHCASPYIYGRHTLPMSPLQPITIRGYYSALYTRIDSRHGLEIEYFHPPVSQNAPGRMAAHIDYFQALAWWSNKVILIGSASREAVAPRGHKKPPGAPRRVMARPCQEAQHRGRSLHGSPEGSCPDDSIRRCCP